MFFRSQYESFNTTSSTTLSPKKENTSLKRSARRKIQYKTGSALLDALSDDMVTNKTATTSMIEQASFCTVDDTQTTENVETDVMETTCSTNKDTVISEMDGGVANAESSQRYGHLYLG